tara:strand:+ start:59 stop:655 length:597 start_codon:yes stop_codon:yes gene_type:complete
VCLGAQARAQNEAARRQYAFQLANRERKWMNTLSVKGVERIQYEQGLNASSLQLANVYADIQQKKGDLVGQALEQDQEDWKQFLQKNTGATLAASGVTGKSARRIQTLDLAEYLKKGSDRVNKMTKAFTELDNQGAQAAGATKQQQMQMFAKEAFVVQPDLAPPQPVMRNVGQAAFMDALSIGSKAVGMASGFGWIGD